VSSFGRPSLSPGALGSSDSSRSSRRSNTYGGPTLRFRNTFIEAGPDASPHGIADGFPGALRRARSAPASRVSADGIGLFSAEEAYVEGLAKKWRLVWAPTASSSSVPEQRRIASVMRTFFGLSRCEGSEPSSMQRVSLVEDAFNEGSLGHPQLCARPCLFFASGRCGNDMRCEFCHLSHPKRPPYLEKRHRDHLQQLQKPWAKALIMPIIERKVRAFDESREVESALARLLLACGSSESEAVEAVEDRRSRRDRALVTALQEMSLRLVIASLERSVLEQHEVEAREASGALLAQLREVAAARDGPVQGTPETTSRSVWSL